MLCLFLLHAANVFSVDAVAAFFTPFQCTIANRMFYEMNEKKIKYHSRHAAACNEFVDCGYAWKTESDREKEREIEAIQPEKFVTCGRPCHAMPFTS